MLRTATVVFSVLSSLGCASIPEKPVVEVGAVDYPADQAIVGRSDGSDTVRRIPLSLYDKATCFRPEEWEREKVYIQLLEQYAQRCQRAAEVAK
jgi:hypothetical protein